MNTKQRRGFLSLVSALALGLALAGPAATASAAPAIYVDDDGEQCDADFNTIHEALTAAAALPTWPTPASKTIIVCAGTYPEPPMLIMGANNLKLQAKPHVTVTPDVPLFAGSLFRVVNSTDVTIRGFTIDGQTDIGPSSMSVLLIPAIEYSSSSGIITKNNIIHWRRASVSNVNIRGINVLNYSGEVVRIENNTLTDFMAIGIDVNSDAVSISSNTLESSSFLASPTWAMYVSNALGGKVSGNKFTSDAYISSGTNSRALTVSDSHKLKISGNTITRFEYGMWLQVTCDIGALLGGNVISKNKLVDAENGLFLRADAASCGSAVHADYNTITGNRFVVENVLAGNHAVWLFVGPAGSTALGTIVKSNTFKHYAPGVELFVDTSTGGSVAGSVFGPNHIIP